MGFVFLLLSPYSASPHLKAPTNKIWQRKKPSRKEGLFQIISEILVFFYRAPTPPFEKDEYNRKMFPLSGTLLAKQFRLLRSEVDGLMKPCSPGPVPRGPGHHSGEAGPAPQQRSLGKAGCGVLCPQSKAGCSPGKTLRVTLPHLLHGVVTRGR